MRRLPKGEERASLAADFARLYEDEQLSIRAIQARTGYSYTGIRTLLIEARVTFREPARSETTLALADDCARLYRRDLSIRAVAAEVGYGYRYTRDLIVLGGAVLRDGDGRSRTAAVEASR
ncbi:hypothetical protein DIZ27_14550 [Streptomyces sp. NWU339]|nr:hypothetical protein DIZ27_14550 [Streptomyces sp. NWU339]